MTRLALVALLAAGCPSIPEPLNAEVEPPAGAGPAAELARAEWAGRLSADLGELPVIRWFEGPCLRWPDDVEQCLDGSTWTPHGLLDADVEIQLVAVAPVHRSALAHELLHWALDESSGDADGDHGAPEWDQVAEVDAALEAAGW